MKKVSSIVNNLQSQSLETRKAIMLGVSVGITALIAIIWLVTFTLIHTNPNTQGKAKTSNPSESPFAIIKNSVVELYANASSATDSTKK